MRIGRVTGHHGASVLTQMVVVVAVVASLIGGLGMWLATVTLNDAQRQAERAAAFRAELAASAISDAVAEGTTAMQGLAAGVPIAALLAAPSKCHLTFSGVGVFATGHIDIVLSDGRVPCSSLFKAGAPRGASQMGAEWLTARKVAAKPSVAGLFTDQLTGQHALAITAPIVPTGTAPGAFATLVLPLNGLRVGLSHTFGGPQQFTFTLRDTHERVLTGDDIHPEGARFQPAADRLSGEHAVPALGWTLSAEQPRHAALAGTRTAFERLAALAAAAFALLLMLLTVLNRRIARPLRGLTAAATEAARQIQPYPVDERGPAEISRLAAEFNAMITARAGYEAQLAHHALHDPLTGLPNRALCLDRIAQALQLAADEPANVALFSVDLDRFKIVNASLGYHTGDDILRAAAQRLTAMLRASDTLARVGDGFVICRLEPGGVDSAALAAALIDCLTEPFAMAGTDVALTASVGFARGRPGAAPEQLLRDADTAMYAAKEAGGGRLRVIDDELRQRSTERLALEADLRGALAHQELHVEYQPVVNLLNGQITGVEALLRWTHPTRGPISPAIFVPLAETTGMIGPIGQYVLAQACQQAVDWTDAGHKLRVAVNMSGLQLHAPDFVESVDGILRRTGLDPAQLCLELTESVLMDDTIQAEEVLRALKGLGVYLSVDDFGTGYSSLAYLKRFPVDELKIDRFFVNTVTAGQDQSLVAAMVAMGHALGLHVLAEGIETEAQRATLLTLGCRSAQGYLFSKPQPAHRIPGLIATAASTTMAAPVTKANSRRRI